MNSTSGGKLFSGAEQWFLNGVDAMDRRNWEYALECLTQAVRLGPDELEYRKQKHRCSRRRFGKTDSPSKVVAVKIVALRSRIMAAQARHDWLSVDELAEDAISLNPWDASMFAELAKAATDAGRIQIARYAWSTALKIDKDNASYFRAFGTLLQANGEYDLAKSCFQRINSIDPTGRIAKELICGVDVAAMINVGGYAHAESSRDVELGVDRKQILAAEANRRKEVSDATEADRQNQNRQLVALIAAGESQIQQAKLCSALQTYRQILQLAPNNVSVLKRFEDVELTLLRKEAADAQKQYASKPTCEKARCLLADCSFSLAKKERDVFTRRATNSPNDSLSLFQLADFFRRVQEFESAIPLFQKVAGNDQLRSEALIGLGECWVRSGHAVEGEEKLRFALSIIDRQSKPNAFKLAHYWLGRLCESRHDAQNAAVHYTEIFEVDGSFRDVRNRLAALQSS